eukprot:3416976-Pleurochrysis_carterae.AAC.1
MANIANGSSASAGVAESPNLPLHTPCSTACSFSVWFNLIPSLACSTVAFSRLLLIFSADAVPCHTPYVVSDHLCISVLSFVPSCFVPSVATARWNSCLSCNDSATCKDPVRAVKTAAMPKQRKPLSIPIFVQHHGFRKDTVASQISRRELTARGRATGYCIFEYRNNFEDKY